MRIVNGGAEDGHGRVPDEFVQRPPVHEYHIRHKREVFVQKRDELVQLEIFAERSEAGDVGEKNRALHCGAAEDKLLLLGENILHHLKGKG